MQKIQIDFNAIKQQIQTFYDPKTHHFMTLNAVGLDEHTLEVQWLFSAYESGEITVLYTVMGYEQRLVSVEDIIPSASISQQEIVDMFGIEIEGSKPGLYLDPDSKAAPLSTCQASTKAKQ